MTAQATRLLQPDDLQNAGRSSALAETDRDALIAVSEWITNFVAQPHKDLGRSGAVCPFVPGSLERRTLWLAAEHVADLEVSEVAGLMEDYKRLFLEVAPADSDDAVYKTIIVVFPDLPAERAGALFGGVLEQLAEPSYEQQGILFGPFYNGNEGTALYNPDFRPFQSPSPFLFVRHTVLSDWKFFLDDDAALDRWARHFGPSGAVALGKVLRHVSWRTPNNAA